jgi:hypothetical protein
MEASKKPFRKVRKYRLPKTRLIILLQIKKATAYVNGIRFNDIKSIEGPFSREWMMEQRSS